MPLPKDMKKCMSKVMDEFPKGRSDKKKSKKKAHKQHVAMCLNASESVTFKDYLILEREDGISTIRKAIAKLKKDGQEVTYASVGKMIGENPAAVERASKTLATVYPEIRDAFNKVH